jgi:hypothetical protein
MDRFDRWKPDHNQLEQLSRVRRRESCTRCATREDTALCICGEHLCRDCIDPHFNDDRDLCPALQINPSVWVEWDATLHLYFAVKVDWRTRQ